MFDTFISLTICGQHSNSRNLLSNLVKYKWRLHIFVICFQFTFSAFIFSANLRYFNVTHKTRIRDFWWFDSESVSTRNVSNSTRGVHAFVSVEPRRCKQDMEQGEWFSIIIFTDKVLGKLSCNQGLLCRRFFLSIQGIWPDREKPSKQCSESVFWVGIFRDTRCLSLPHLSHSCCRFSLQLILKKQHTTNVLFESTKKPFQSSRSLICHFKVVSLSKHWKLNLDRSKWMSSDQSRSD